MYNLKHLNMQQLLNLFIHTETAYIRTHTHTHIPKQTFPCKQEIFQQLVSNFP